MDKKDEIHDSPTKDLSARPPDIVNHCTITIRVHEFSLRSKEVVIDSAACEHVDSRTFVEHVFPYLLIDGTISENEEYVWICFLFRSLKFTEYNSIVFGCLASVIDESGNERFTQSMVRVSNTEKESIKHEFIKRSFLLDNSPELLPDDTLTVRLDIDYKIQCEYWRCISVKDIESSGLVINKKGEWYIYMDSTHGQNLRKLSSVLQRMMETPMTESITRLLPLKSSEEQYYFLLIYHIEKGDEFAFETIGDIRGFYEFADKYDMPSILQLCRDLMMGVLLAISSTEVLDYVSKDIHVISEMADRFSMDESLKDILEMYEDIVRKFQGGTGELEASGISKVETEWICKYKGKFFVFRNNKRMPTDLFEQKDCYR